MDLSHRCLVLTADELLWRRCLRDGVGIACLGGENLRPVRVDPSDTDELRTDAHLDLLECGALVIADLVGMDERVFSLVSWFAKMRPASVVLLRHGPTPLPFQIKELPVRSLDLATDDVAVREVLSDWAVDAAARRRDLEPFGDVLSTEWGNAAHRKRREKNGVAPALRDAARGLLDGRLDAAREAAYLALVAEPNAPDLLLRAGLLHQRAGRWADAALVLERASHISPDQAPIWRELGVARDTMGSAGAEDALRRATDIGGDYQALIKLAILLSRDGRAEEAVTLLERAMLLSSGQLNLVLPTMVGRAQRDKRVTVSPWERSRLLQVMEIRGAQADASPPEDAPWSFFDAAQASLLLGENDRALDYATRAKEELSAPWQAAILGKALDGLEDAKIEVSALREVLDLKRNVAAPVAEAAEPTPPFAAATRDAAWYVENVPCMAACPVGTDAGAYVQLTAQRRFEEAFHVARGPNPFASVCGRICAAPCEDACRRGNIDGPVEIRSLKRFLTERHGVEGFSSTVDSVIEGEPAPCIEGDAYISHLRKRRTDAPKRIAVIGGGPAGMACAHDLALLGHHVTIFEASHQLGGMMRQGIPIYRLSRDLLELESGLILSLGVEVKLGTPLTPERTLMSLLDDGYDAAFLATGAGKGRDLAVEGSGLDGVVRAIDFLLNANHGYRVELGARVVVVGGGNVALDVARTARLGRPPDQVWRQADQEAAQQDLGPSLEGQALRSALTGGMRDVHVLARQPMGEWPAQRSVRGREELEHAQDEGIVFHPLRGLRRIVGHDGRVTGVELAEVIQVHDESGRYAPMYGAQAAEAIKCDAVILAVGQTPDLDYLGADIETSPWGLIAVDDDLATSVPGVFAGGDAAFGPRTLIEGVSDGKRAARGIHAWLGGESELSFRYTFEELHPREVPVAKGYDAIPRESPPCREVGRRTGISEVELGFDEEQAVAQAERCLACHVQTVYDGELCIACGHCTDICPYACLSFVEPADVALETSLTVASSSVFMIKDEDHCIRCGLCAERCPTGAMTMEQFEAEAEARAS